MDLIKVAEEAFATGKEFPKFKAGDTITVAYKIIEGSKERIHSTAVWLLRFQAKAPRSVSQFVRCQEL